MGYKDKAQTAAYNKAYYAAKSTDLKARVRAYYAENRDSRVAYEKMRYQRDKAKRLLLSRKRYAAKREAILAQHREYAAAHKEHKRGYDAIYNRLFAARHAARALAWCHANPDKRQTISSRYRANLRAAPINDFTDEQWTAMQAHYRYRCVYCGKKPKVLSQDHLTPLSKGGAHTASNIVPACRRCNSKKGARAPLCPVQPLLL